MCCTAWLSRSDQPFCGPVLGILLEQADYCTNGFSQHSSTGRRHLCSIALFLPWHLAIAFKDRMKRIVPATPFRVVKKAGQSEMTTSSESPEQSLAVTPAQDSSTVAASSSPALATSSRKRGRTGQSGAYGSSSPPSSGPSFHPHVQHNTQHNTLNSIDHQQLNWRT